MPVFLRLLARDVKNLLAINYPKIEMQTSGFKYNNEIIETFTFLLVDLSNPFEINRFIEL